MKYVTTITVIHEASSTHQAILDGEAYVTTLKEAVKAIDNGVTNTTLHITRYNTMVKKVHV